MTHEAGDARIRIASIGVENLDALEIGIESRAIEIQAMASALRKLVHSCHGDERPDCPILDDLGGA